MSWPEAIVGCVTAICVMLAVIHVFADGITITITHKNEDEN